jgi:hypothetical protein
MRARGGGASRTLAVLALITLASACASHGRVATRASSFLPLTSTPNPSTTRTATSPSDSPSVSPTGSPTEAVPSVAPCPVPAPEKFVEGTAAKKAADGEIVFYYRLARQICDAPDGGTFKTIGKEELHANVDPSAIVLLLPPNGAADDLQVPVGALPAALAANTQAPYYAVTFDDAGLITRIEQYFHP